MILSRGSIILILRGLRGGSYRNKVKFFKANQLIRDPPCDSYETCLRGEGCCSQSRGKTFVLVLYVAWVVLHRNRHIGASERRQLIPHVRFQVPFLGRKVN